MPTTRAAMAANQQTAKPETPLARVARATSIFKPYDGAVDMTTYIEQLRRTASLAEFQSYDETAMFVSACFQNHKQAEAAALVKAANEEKDLLDSIDKAFTAGTTPLINAQKLLRTTQGGSTTSQYNDRFAKQTAQCRLDMSSEQTQLFLAAAFVNGLADEDTRAFINTQDPPVSTYSAAATLAIQFRDRAKPNFRRTTSYADRTRDGTRADKAARPPMSAVKCYNCNGYGHMAKYCTKPATTQTKIAALTRELRRENAEVSSDTPAENE